MPAHLPLALIIEDDEELRELERQQQALQQAQALLLRQSRARKLGGGGGGAASPRVSMAPTAPCTAAARAASLRFAAERSSSMPCMAEDSAPCASSLAL